MEIKESMKDQATTGILNNGSRRRHSFSQANVRAIFSCINNDGLLPHDIHNLRIIIVPNVGSNNGTKLSPPPYEYEDGVYVFIRLHVIIPSILSHRILTRHDLALISECAWCLSGPQYSGESVDLQQRYCTPKGREGEYCSHMKGAIWTMIDSNGKESFDCRVFHVYRSSKRSISNSGSPRKPGAPPAATRPKRVRSSPFSKMSSPKVSMPDPDTQKSNPKVGTLFDGIRSEVASSCNIVGSSSMSVNADNIYSENGLPDALRRMRRQEKSSAESNEPNINVKIVSGAGNARQATRSWTTDEDTKLVRLVEREIDVARIATRIAWNVLAQQMDNRSGKQCRERYVNHLNPDRKKGKWTEPEDALIDQLQATLGNQWSKVAAALPGRSDNDVKNRWHSRMRSQKRRHANISAVKLNKDDREEKPKNTVMKQERKKISKSTNLRGDSLSQEESAADNSTAAWVREETPKVGQRVQVKFDGGKKLCEGTITKVLQGAKSTKEQCYTLFIHYDNGESEEADFPDKGICLAPMSNKLLENDIMLCCELLNLHSTLKSPDKASGGKNQVSEEEPRFSSEHSSAGSREISGPLQESVTSSYENTARASSTGEGLEFKSSARGHHGYDKDAKKPSSGLSTHASKAEVSANDRATAFITSPSAMFSRRTRTAMPRGFPPTALNNQSRAFQHRSAPYSALPNQEQQRLLAAAQLLSSVNPGLAVAAISQAQNYNNHCVSQQHQVQAPDLHFQRYLSSNGSSTNFPNLTMPYLQLHLATRSIPRRETNLNDDGFSTDFPNLTIPNLQPYIGTIPIPRRETNLHELLAATVRAEHWALPSPSSQSEFNRRL